MSDDTEPTNEQLAKFMVVYGSTNPLLAGLNVNPYFLERIFNQNESHRQMCLKIHRNFQNKLIQHYKALVAGELQCEHIRPNGKRCPNFNEPGSFWCGLHQNEGDDDEGIQGAGLPGTE